MSKPNPLNDLLLQNTPSEFSKAITLLYDSFIRDPVNGELPHEERVKVHYAQKELIDFFERIEHQRKDG